MPSSKFEWLNRVKSVEREHAAVRFSTTYLLDGVRHDPSILGRDLRSRDVEEASKRLEGTYVIRLFAEFETSLRLFWSHTQSTDPPSRTRDLLDGVGARRRIPFDTIQNAHVVREFRNTLIHERDEEFPAVQIAKARRSLCVFLNFLPTFW